MSIAASVGGSHWLVLAPCPHAVFASDDLRAWLQLIATVLAAIALLGSFVQLRLVRRTVVGNAFGNVFSEIREIHKTLASYPQLRPYFAERRPAAMLTPGSDDYHRAQEIADMHLDAFMHMYVLGPRFAPKEREAIDAYIRHLCASSEVLSQHLAPSHETRLPREVGSSSQGDSRDLLIFACRKQPVADGPAQERHGRRARSASAALN